MAFSITLSVGVPSFLARILGLIPTLKYSVPSALAVFPLVILKFPAICQIFIRDISRTTFRRRTYMHQIFSLQHRQDKHFPATASISVGEQRYFTLSKTLFPLWLYVPLRSFKTIAYLIVCYHIHCFSVGKPFSNPQRYIGTPSSIRTYIHDHFSNPLVFQILNVLLLSRLCP